MNEEINIYFKKEVIRKLKGSSCLVTGGTGMIGREVVRLLKLIGAKVTSVSLDNLRIQKKHKICKRGFNRFQFL